MTWGSYNLKNKILKTKWGHFNLLALCIDLKQL